MSAEEEIVDYESDHEVKKTEDVKGAGKGHYVGVHTSNFPDLLLKPELLRAITDCGFEHPSEVQHECLPNALVGMDVICQAKSGMGKTAVFVLATLNQMEPKAGEVSVVVLAHARELAYQIGKEYNRFSKYMPSVKTTVLFGGVPVKKHLELIQTEKPNIIVGTPGRVKDLAGRPDGLDLSKVKFFILDECDKMLEGLDMRADIQKIFMSTPRLKQVMMFSATMPENIRAVARKFMTDPMEVKVDKASELRLHGLKQFYVRLKPEEKTRKLTDLLDALEFNQVVVFVSKVVRAEELCRLLKELSFPAITVHAGIKDQAERIRRYTDFKEFRSRIMVTTDLFGRGIDVERVNIVINYDFPQANDRGESYVDSYLHRIGRAGRFGTKGMAISFVSGDEDEKAFEEVQQVFADVIPELPDTIDQAEYMQTEAE